MSRSRFDRIFRANLLLTALSTALLPGCAPSSSRNRLVRTAHVAAAAAALRADGTGAIVFVGAADDWLYEMTVFANGGIGGPRKVVKEAAAIALQFASSEAAPARAAWLVEDGVASGRGPLHSASRGSNGKWGAVETVDPGTVESGAFELVCDASGNALLVWETAGSIVASVAAPDLPFGAPTVLFAAADPVVADSPRAAMNASGRGLIACHAGSGPTDRQVVAWSFDPALGFAPLGRIDEAPQGATEEVAVAIAADGAAAVAWYEPSFSLGDILLRRVDAGGLLLPLEPTVVSSTEVTSLEPRFGSDGALILGFKLFRDVSWVRSPAPGVFDPRENTSVAGDSGSARFGFEVEASGRVTCVAIDSLGSDLDVNAARFSDGHADSRLGSLRPSPGSAPPSGLVVAQGGPLTLACWIVDQSLEIFTWFDPVADFVVRPRSPVVGEPAQLDATGSFARSTATGLVEFQWDLDGDGVFEVEQTTAKLDHVFTAAGVHPLALRVVDEWQDAAVLALEVEVFGGPDIDPPWELIVTVDGGGSVRGDLDSNGDGTLDIDVPGDGEESYADGVITFLTPTAAAGFVFDHWEGLSSDFFDGDYGVEGCLVQMRADRSIKAVFVAR